MIGCTRCGKNLQDVEWTDLGTDMVCDDCLTPDEKTRRGKAAEHILHGFVTLSFLENGEKCSICNVMFKQEDDVIQIFRGNVKHNPAENQLCIEENENSLDVSAHARCIKNFNFVVLPK